ncbi:MAG: hypothetical protein IJY92_05475 [Alphaproteobacteria bacterium]|nr:hypothetical protein [Alphaproteobacteria bacterium]
MSKHLEKYATAKEVKKVIHTFKKLLWKLPKVDRVNIVSFIKSETKCCSWWPLPYVSEKLFDTLTGTLSSENLKNKMNKKETLSTPFSKVLKNKKKSHKLMNIIQSAMSFISIDTPEKKEKLFNHILNEPTYYKIKNKIQFKPLAKKVSDALFQYGLCLISPNYKQYIKSEKIFQQLVETKGNISLSNKEINSILGHFITAPQNFTPKKITTSKNKLFYNISKDIRVHIND